VSLRLELDEKCLVRQHCRTYLSTFGNGEFCACGIFLLKKSCWILYLLSKLDSRTQITVGKIYQFKGLPFHCSLIYRKSADLWGAIPWIQLLCPFLELPKINAIWICALCTIWSTDRSGPLSSPPRVSMRPHSYDSVAPYLLHLSHQRPMTQLRLWWTQPLELM
jgi:hypothetical protein